MSNVSYTGVFQQFVEIPAAIRFKNHTHIALFTIESKLFGAGVRWDDLTHMIKCLKSGQPISVYADYADIAGGIRDAFTISELRTLRMLQ